MDDFFLLYINTDEEMVTGAFLVAHICSPKQGGASVFIHVT